MTDQDSKMAAYEKHSPSWVCPDQGYALDCTCGWRGVLWSAPEGARREFSEHWTVTPMASEPRRRLRGCVEAWPECETMAYDPRCCRFPKSCSCDVYDEQYVTEDDLEPRRG